MLPAGPQRSWKLGTSALGPGGSSTGRLRCHPACPRCPHLLPPPPPTPPGVRGGGAGGRRLRASWLQRRTALQASHHLRATL